MSILQEEEEDKEDTLIQRILNIYLYNKQQWKKSRGRTSSAS